MKRTDIHRPTAIQPEDYDYVCQEYLKVEDLGTALALQAERAKLKAHMERTGGTYSGHEHGGNCMVCGSPNAIYTVMFYHRPTNTYVRMGQDCATMCAMGDPKLFKRFRETVQELLKARSGKRKAEAVLAEAGLTAAWTIYDTNPAFSGGPKPEDFGFVWNGDGLENPATGQIASYDEGEPYFRARRQWDADHREEFLIFDIVGKLVRYGSISEKQTNFLRSLLDRIGKRDERLAARKAESEAAADCPTGRIVIEGEVLTVRVDEGGQWGPTTKILVKHESGWKVWGTRPSWTNVEKGDRLRFTATVTPSDQDPKFGYFKRPAKAEVLYRAKGGAEAEDFNHVPLGARAE